MAIKTIQLSRLENDLEKALDECAGSGETLVVELPDQRLLAILPLDPVEEDSLMDELLAANPRFRELVAKSKASPRKPFRTGMSPDRRQSVARWRALAEGDQVATSRQCMAVT